MNYLRRLFRQPPLSTTPKLFFDVSLNGTPMGTIQFSLFDDIVPHTANNFR